jgi:hypothetical protein
MSFFISAIALEGLMSSPPVSKATPLPTTAISGASASPQRRSMSRGGVAEARPTAWNHREILLEEVVADDDIDRRAVASGQAARADSMPSGPRSFAGVLTRSRPSATASAIRLTSSMSTPSGATSRTGLAAARDSV